MLAVLQEALQDECADKDDESLETQLEMGTISEGDLESEEDDMEDDDKLETDTRPA
jgi:hypothetical protein